MSIFVLQHLTWERLTAFSFVDLRSVFFAGMTYLLAIWKQMTEAARHTSPCDIEFYAANRGDEQFGPALMHRAAGFAVMRLETCYLEHLGEEGHVD